jgi:hypothetical protein
MMLLLTIAAAHVWEGGRADLTATIDAVQVYDLVRIGA